jgi:hypothetical protein
MLVNYTESLGCNIHDLSVLKSYRRKSLFVNIERSVGKSGA